MTTSSIITLGSINTDLVIKGPRLPVPGETVLGGQFFQAAGGKGANQAVAAARVSREPVTLVGAIGDDDFGRAALDGFARENLCRDYIRTVAGQPSGVALILVDEAGQNCISVASGANMCLSPADVDALPETLFAEASVFLTCLELPLETVRRGLERARQAGLLTILNPAPADGRLVDSAILPLVDVLTPNETEAQMLVGRSVEDRASAVAAARALQQSGCRSVIVTLGARGSVVVQDGEAFVTAIEVAAVDATAAGDAFNGTLAVALAEGRSLVEAAHRANVAAGLAVTREGAQPSLPSRAEIEARIARHD